MRELKDQFVDNWQSFLLIVLFMLGIAYINVQGVTSTLQRENQLHGQICAVIQASKKGAQAQHTYYTNAAARAYARSKVDKGASKQLDLESYQNLTHIATQYSKPFNFPGC